MEQRNRFMEFLKHKTIIFAILVIFLLMLGLYVFVLSKNDQKNIGVLPTPVLSPELVVSQFPAPEFAPDQIIVEFKTGQAIDEIKDENRKKELDNYLKEIGVVSEEKVFKNTKDLKLKNFYILKLKKGTDVLETKKLLEKLPEVKSAEPDHIIRAL